MGNKSGKLEATKHETKEEVGLKVLPPLDPHLMYWVDRDIQMMNNFTPRNRPLLTPPDRYVEYMRLYGWLDLDMDDPELTTLFN